jgi:hypothetical protein
LFTGLLQAAVLEFLKGLSVYYTALTISRKLLFLGDNFIFFALNFSLFNPGKNGGFE